MSPTNPPDAPVGEDPIRAIVARLARPHPRGIVIERAAILAEGAASAEIVDWIISQAGVPEVTTATAPPRGLHGGRDAPNRRPMRYVLPTEALA
jgi:hypothetical protein